MAEPIPPLTWQAFHVPKMGNASSEYEDAVAGDAARGRFAIADGASESSYASSWADILVKSYVRRSGPWSRWLPAARKRWRLGQPEHDLPWYAQTKFEEGAFAAIAGLHFEGERWHAEAVGDSCLFQVRAGKLRRAFPLKHSGEFGNQPNLLGSRPCAHAGARTRRFRLHSDWQMNDVFLLMTDALAQWFLEKVEERQETWRNMLQIETAEEFAERVDALRGADELRNDDVSMIRIPLVERAS